MTLNCPSSRSLKLHVKYFENGVRDATASGRYTSASVQAVTGDKIQSRISRTAEVGFDFVRNNAMVPETLGARRRRSSGPRQRPLVLRLRRHRLTTSSFAVTPSSSPTISAQPKTIHNAHRSATCCNTEMSSNVLATRKWHRPMSAT